MPPVPLELRDLRRTKFESVPVLLGQPLLPEPRVCVALHLQCTPQRPVLRLAFDLGYLAESLPALLDVYIVYLRLFSVYRQLGHHLQCMARVSAWRAGDNTPVRHPKPRLRVLRPRLNLPAVGLCDLVPPPQRLPTRSD
jgi:hypothetical protein